MVAVCCLGNLFCNNNLISHKNLYKQRQAKEYLLDMSVLKDSTIKNHFNNEEFTVIFVFGQSNSANYGQTKYEPKEEVYNWFDGNISKAKDPLKGADGNGGSVWGRLGDKLITSKLAKKVLIIPIGIGSTTVADWSEDGIYYNRIISTVLKLKRQNIDIDFILWHQGESDNLENTPTEDYIYYFESIRLAFLNKEVEAPIFVSIASYHPNENSLRNKKFGSDVEIQRAQESLIKKHQNLFLGANTDKLDKSYYRFDGVHFSVLGLEKHAELWLDILKKAIEEKN